MKTLRYLNTCQPDYFNGFSGTVLIASHWKDQTIAEAIEDLERNANNESHDKEVYEAIDNYKKSVDKIKENQAIDDRFCEPDENGDTGLIHYFGVIDDE